MINQFIQYIRDLLLKGVNLVTSAAVAYNFNTFKSTLKFNRPTVDIIITYYGRSSYIYLAQKKDAYGNTISYRWMKDTHF